MTGVAFVILGALAYAWYSISGAVVADGVTVWIAWWLGVYAVCGIYVLYVCIRSDFATKALYAVLGVFWLVGQLIWVRHLGYFAHAHLHAVTAFMFFMIGNRPTHYVIGYILMAAVGVDLLAYHGSITPGALRRHVFVDWSYPDFLAAFSHAAVIVLGSDWDRPGGSRRRTPGGTGGVALGHPDPVVLRRSGARPMDSGDGA